MIPAAPIDPLTGLSAARLGLYVHFPYCLSKCPYCDFASTVAKEIPEERYAKAILAELELRLERFPQLAGRSLESVFFGGGTPSLWDPGRVERVLRGITSHLPLADRAEVTLEANPGAADASRFEGFRAAGINRLSIGVQSFQARTLAALGRAHDGSAAESAFRAARKAKFANVSMDFIYGVHGQELDEVRRDAERAATLEPEHLSAYALTLEREALAEEVPLARQLARGEVTLPSDDQTLEMGHAIGEIYAAHGPLAPQRALLDRGRIPGPGGRSDRLPPRWGRWGSLFKSPQRRTLSRRGGSRSGAGSLPGADPFAGAIQRAGSDGGSTVHRNRPGRDLQRLWRAFFLSPSGDRSPDPRWICPNAGPAPGADRGGRGSAQQHLRFADLRPIAGADHRFSSVRSRAWSRSRSAANREKPSYFDIGMRAMESW